MRYSVKKYVIMCGDQFVAGHGQIVPDLDDGYFYETPQTALVARIFDPEIHRIKELEIIVDSDSKDIEGEASSSDLIIFASKMIDRSGQAIMEIAQTYGPIQHAFFKAKSFADGLVNPYIVYGHFKEKDKRQLEQVLGLTLRVGDQSGRSLALESKSSTWSDLPVYRFLMAETDAVAVHLMFPKTLMVRYDPDGVRNKVIDEIKSTARRTLVATEAANIKIVGKTTDFETKSVDYLLRKLDLAPELWNPKEKS